MVTVRDDSSGKLSDKAIADARAAGVAGTTQLVHVYFEGMPGAVSAPNYSFSITLDQAAGVCDTYRHERVTAEANTAFDDVIWGFTWLDADDDARLAHPEVIQGLVESAQRCSGTVDRLLAAGADPDRVLRTQKEGLTLRTMKKDVCEEIEKRAKARVIERTEQEEQVKKLHAAWVAKMNKIGVNGDRLDVMDRFWDGLYGVGHVPLTEARQAKAAVMFRALQDNDLIYIHKFLFKGNKLLREETKTYSRLQYDWEDSRLYR